MKILCITPNVPQAPGTGSESRVFYLIKELASLHEFHVYCPARKKEAGARKELSSLCAVHAIPVSQDLSGAAMVHRLRERVKVGIDNLLSCAKSVCIPSEYLMHQWFRSACREIIRQEVDITEFDLIEFHHSQSYPVISSWIGKVPVMANLHNINWTIAERSKGLLPLPWINHNHVCFWRRLEREVLENVDLAVTVSDRDCASARALIENSQLRIIPNGTDGVHFKPLDGNLRRGAELLFCGLMDYQPNADAARLLVREILPRIRRKVRNCHLLLVGKNPGQEVQKLAGNGVEITGWVQDAAPYYQRCSVFVSPLRLGGGMRLKILDALACGAPVVASSIACEGIGVEDGKHVILRDDPQSFADAVIDLLEQPEKGRELGREGRALIEKNYDWKALACEMNRAYEETVLQFQKRRVAKGG